MSNSENNLQKKLAELPQSPGVYLFKDMGATVIYVGKALNLKKRVGSYFQNRPQSPKITVLVQRIADIEVIETQTEVDALLLEAHLIRRFTPRYNSQLKDDKSYPLLKVTAERYPRLIISRKRTDSKSIYYGPYTDAKLLREAVRIINGLFPIRKCQALPKHACLYYHIGQCLAPCIRPDVKSAYDRLITEIKSFLQGGRKSLADYLTDRMKEAAGEFRFEDAQFFKDQIEALCWFRKKRFHPKRPESGIGLRGTMELKQLLSMDHLPEKIVCLDVSNIQGDEAVASKVCFYRELPNTLEYRRYKIKSVEGIDDYAMIQEALRRMIRGIEGGKESSFPDLILIDGGKGHLNAAVQVLTEERCPEIQIASIAKRFEWIYCPKEKGPLSFPPESSALRLVQRIRDEAHRFAITYHRLLKGKQLSRSMLDKIEGIGKKRKRLLLAAFQSLDELRDMPVDRLARMEGMNAQSAARVIEFLKGQFPGS